VPGGDLENRLPFFLQQALKIHNKSSWFIKLL